MCLACQLRDEEQDGGQRGLARVRALRHPALPPRPPDGRRQLRCQPQSLAISDLVQL